MLLAGARTPPDRTGRDRKSSYTFPPVPAIQPRLPQLSGLSPPPRHDKSRCRPAGFPASGRSESLPPRHLLWSEDAPVSLPGGNQNSPFRLAHVPLIFRPVVCMLPRTLRASRGRRMFRQIFRRKSLDEILHEGEVPSTAQAGLGRLRRDMLGIGRSSGGDLRHHRTAAAGDPSRPGAGRPDPSFVVTAIACAFAPSATPSSPHGSISAAPTPIPTGRWASWCLDHRVDLIIEYAWATSRWPSPGPITSRPSCRVRHHHPRLDFHRLRRPRDPGLFENAPPLRHSIVFNVLSFGIVALITILLVIGIGKAPHQRRWSS